MTPRHPDNERAKRRYLQYLKDVKGRDESSLDAVAKAIDDFDAYNKYRDFRKFHIEQARGFKGRLDESRNARTGRSLSASTITSRLASLKAFFEWLAQEPTYRSRIKASDASYFNPPENLARVASARRYKPFPTLKQIESVLESMPRDTEIHRRDRAVIAFAILTGARDRAIVSFKLKHIDVDNRMLHQDAREVRTKRAKTFTSWFFPVGADIEKLVVEWVAFLRTERGYGPDDPIFPKTKIVADAIVGFRADGLDRAHWANADPVRGIFRQAFIAAGLPYHHPHSLRRTLMQVAYDRKLDAEQVKAWSQNYGHDDVLTTMLSYGAIAPERQAEVMRALATPATRLPSSNYGTAELFRQLADKAARGELGL